MKLHELYTTPGSHKTSKRLGRGDASGKGGSAGKGTKGQMSRKGHKRKLGFEGGQMVLLRRLPKRGFNNPERIAYLPVNLAALNRFEDGAVVDAAALVATGLAKKFERGGFKVLAKGELTKKLTIKANEVSEAVRKAGEHGRRNLMLVTMKGSTIPHAVTGQCDGGRVLLMPASDGTGLIAGGGMRAVLEMAGVRNVLGKSQGSKNRLNVVKATFDALSQLRT